MIVNRQTLLRIAPIKNMLSTKETANGVTHGMSEAGYDIRIKQSVTFDKADGGRRIVGVMLPGHAPDFNEGRFALASAMEEFQMPNHLVGIVHDKSSWARKGLSVFNTVVEPGFHGGLTLELVFHGEGTLTIPAGAGIAQVLFHIIAEPAAYAGKYQFQSTDPEPARDA